MVERAPWGNGIGLSNKTILFGITGGIAAFKAAFYLRSLKNFGAKVVPVLTENAAKFVTPMTFSALANEKAWLDAFEGDPSSLFAHIEIPKDADCFVVCPATANCLAKAANGIADDLLTTMILAYKGSVLFFPSMNPAMYQNPATQNNLEKLRKLGHVVVEPATGQVACGDQGKGRLVEFEEFLHEVQSSLFPKPLLGKKILVTAGPTREPIDPVRFLSNNSSGKMGFEIAWACKMLGAEVTLIKGPTQLSPPNVHTLLNVETANEMFEAVKEVFPQMDVVIMTAAVADYTPEKVSKTKIKKKDYGEENLNISLKKTQDILKYISRNRSSKQVIVGFCAETENLIENARKKLANKPVDMLVCNDITEKGAGFDKDTNKVSILHGDGSKIEELPLMSKANLALELMNRVSSLL